MFSCYRGMFFFYKDQIKYHSNPMFIFREVKVFDISQDIHSFLGYIYIYMNKECILTMDRLFA